MKRWILVLSLLIALSGGIYGALVLLNQPTPSQTNVQAVQQTIEPITVQALHEAVNAKRREAGVPELVLDERLNESACSKASTMHTRADAVHDGFAAFIDDVSPEATVLGENLAQTNENTMAVVDGWMNSERHRRNILDSRYTRVGYCVEPRKLDALDSVVQHFTN